MAKNARYKAEFFDRNDRKYRIEILQEVEEAPAEWPLDVTLAADPVTIEWSEVEKLDPVQGSCATLRLVSMNDRQFFDMYSVEYGSIELRVYRETDDGFSLYWAGTLDPELFEEPYSYQDRYITELSFVDFAPLEYINWDGKGMMSIRSIITKCVEAAKFEHNSQYTELVATTTNSGDSALECMVLAENFYDDDDEPMTLREVLEEVLRPFALRLLQKNGSIMLFDLHSLSTAPTDVVAWRGTDASIEADRVYNNISVKLSPFHNETILDASIDPDEVLKEGDEGVISGNVYGYGDASYSSSPGALYYQYTAWRRHMKQSPIEYGNLKIKNGAVMFRVEPVYSGNKEAFVAWSFSTSLPSNIQGELPWPDYGITNQPICAMGDSYNKDFPTYPVSPIIETKPIYVSKDSAGSILLAQLTAMFDARYDWFSAADAYKTSYPLKNYDFKNNEEAIKSIGLCFIPVVITLRDEQGNIRYKYSNNNLRIGVQSSDRSSAGRPDGYGIWESVTAQEDIYKTPAWFAYYPEDFFGQGVMSNGWQDNKRVLYSKWKEVPPFLTARNEGEYIPIPPESGYLVVEVCAGHLFQRWGDNRMTSPDKALPNTDPIYTERARTVAYKSVTIKLVSEYGLGELAAKDIEDVAWINKAAREALDISTIVGTPNEKMPAARGVLRDPNGEQVDTLKRGDHIGRAEKLLIGTAYSQFAERKNVLSGTAELIDDFKPLTDQATSGRYVLLGEVQNLEDATSNVRMAEFTGDIYDSIEEKNE